MFTKAHRARVAAIVLTFLGLSVLVWGRLLWLQVVGAGRYLRVAHLQHHLVVELPATRGTIYDRHLQPLATDIRLPSIYADPRWVKDKAAAARQLAPLLGVPAPVLQERLTQHRGFVWLARKTSNRAAYRIRQLRLAGVEMIKEPRRVYPGGTLAAHVVGFAGLDHHGLEGLELTLDPVLRGRPGWRWLQRDAKQRRLEAWSRDAVAPRHGLDVVLTIDQVIQYAAERALETAYRTHRAEGACLVVLRPRTGEILAMANRPTFDPNRPGAAAAEARRNRAITDVFEPGSVFKIVTASAVLGEGAVKATDRLFCEHGEWAVAGRVLHDAHPHGWLTFAGVIENSSNIGTAKAAIRLGPAPLHRYITTFGFGQRTGVELPGEAPGYVRPLAQWSRPSITVIPMGYEVTATALQLALLAATVANDGVLMRPWVIQAVRDAAGQTVRAGRPEVVRQVISAELAAELTTILAGVVERGTGGRAAVDGYRVAGKTGTAKQVEGGLYTNRYRASFVGFVPADDPQLAIAIVVDRPRPYYYGGTVAAPVFHEVAAQVLPYLEQRPHPAPRLVTASLTRSEVPWD